MVQGIGSYGISILDMHGYLPGGGVGADDRAARILADFVELSAPSPEGRGILPVRESQPSGLVQLHGLTTPDGMLQRRDPSVRTTLLKTPR